MEDQNQAIELHSTRRGSPSIPTQIDLKEQLYQRRRLPLGSHCIRILDILPNSPTASNGGNDAIRCRPRVVDLDDNPSFTALSYVWGIHSPKPEYVLCDNVPIEVTSNCLLALQSLRRKLGTLSIWVDAICINQSDQAEKSHQIPLMSRIYSLAAVVYVWLGPGTDRTDRVMAYLDKIPLENYFKMTRQGRSSPRTFAAGLYLTFIYLRPRHHPLPLKGTKYYNKPIFGGEYVTFKELEDLLSCKWIARLWTFQEILLATNPVVVCGDYHAPWHRVECSILFLDTFRWISGDDGVLHTWATLMISRTKFRDENLEHQAMQSYDASDYRLFVRKVLGYRDACISLPIILMVLTGTPLLAYPALTLFLRATMRPRKNGEGYQAWAVALTPIGVIWVLLQILCLVRLLIMTKVPFLITMFSPKRRLIADNLLLNLYLREATNPKDMAFGMWAVLEHQKASKLPAPDYSLDLGSIYRTFSIDVYEANKSLQPLLFAAIKGIPGQPSWVADWSASASRAVKSKEINVLFEESIGNSAQKLSLRRTALRQDSPWFEINDASGIFTTRARYLGKISVCSDFLVTNDHYEEAELDKHIKNISAMIQWATQAKSGWWNSHSWGNSHSWWMPGIENSAPVIMFNYKELGVWAALFSPGSNDAFKILRTLRERPRILKQHIRICNQLAEGAVMVFSATWLDEQSNDKSLRGLCLRGTEPGNRLLHIEGMPYLLIVRKLQENMNVKIISPVGATSRWIKDRWWFTPEEKEWFDTRDRSIEFEDFKFQ